MLILSDRWETRSLFGEAFGALDTLFSGLAFAGLIYTIALQRKELQLQREELRLTREELARTASAQEKSEAALQQQSETMLFTARLTAMTSIIELRRIREGILGAPSGRHLEQLSTFITELEAEFASIRQELPQRKEGPDARDIGEGQQSNMAATPKQGTPWKET